MGDQADKLRTLRLVGSKTRPHSEPTGETQRRARVRSIAVTSGKGGVGKSFLLTNLALALAQRNRRVLLVDGDLSLANVDLLMGLIPQKNLGDLILGDASIEEVVIDALEGIRLLPAASGVEELADLDDFRRETLLRQLSQLEDQCDLILLDTGSGISRQVMHIALAADEVLIVTTPEPTAFSDAYATLKVLHRRGAVRPMILVNQVTSQTEATQTARRIQTVSRRFLGFEPEYAGYVLADPAVTRSVRRQEPLLRMFPHSAAAGCLNNLAEFLLQQPEPHPPISVDPDESYFAKVANLDA